MAEPQDLPELTPFVEAVIEVVESVPAGEVMTYGEVAAEAGKPGAARAVGGIMRRYGSDLPWWRIVASNGRLVPGGEKRHAAKLRAEGVVLRKGRVAMGSAAD